MAQFASRVKQVVVVASSSRGGSSLVAELLRQSPDFIHLRGEITPLLAVNGHTFPRSGTGSDALPAWFAPPSEELSNLREDLAYDSGRPVKRLKTEEELHRFAVDLTCRLTLQWPDIDWSLGAVADAMHTALRTLVRLFDWPPGAFVDAKQFHAVFLGYLTNLYREVNPYYYDLDPRLLGEVLPAARVRRGWPVGLAMIEEPPFITIGPWAAVSDDDCERPLVIKTPSNAYRLEYFAKLFPRAELRLLHLTRNPAATINGLIDGWQYPGFFSHAVPDFLDIRGYSDQFQGHGREWWKFDLPPGWRAWTKLRLEEVCLMQWASAHRAILDYVRKRRLDGKAYIRLPFERVLGTPASRAAMFADIARWIGADDEAHERLKTTVSGSLPPVMMTAHQTARRWRQRAEIIEPLLARTEITSLVGRLGYAADRSGWL